MSVFRTQFGPYLNIKDEIKVLLFVKKILKNSVSVLKKVPKLLFNLLCLKDILLEPKVQQKVGVL